MGAVSDRRQEAACVLVLASRAGLEAAQTTADALVDSLVKAHVEMQKGALFTGSPIAPIQGVFSEQIERSSDRPLCGSIVGEHDVKALRHRLRHLREKCAIQIAAPPH